MDFCSVLCMTQRATNTAFKLKEVQLLKNVFRDFAFFPPSHCPCLCFEKRVLCELALKHVVTAYQLYQHDISF